VSLAAYGNSTCAAKTDGTVWCWGAQSGAAKPLTITTPQKVLNLIDVVALAGGNGFAKDHICALQKTGTVQCWGSNNFGQLGNGTTTDSTTPQQVVNLIDAASIAASSDNTCAIKADATVVCWGSASNGIVSSPLSANSAPITIKGVNAVSLAMSNNMACAVASDGSVQCWGTNNGLQASKNTLSATPVTLSGISNVNALTLGNTHACALLMDATVTCWGTYFGTATTPPVVQPTPVAVNDANNTPLSNVQSISSGIDHTCASKFDGTVHCWGWNSSGQLGEATNIDSMVAQPVMNAVNAAANVKALFTGLAHACALKANGDVDCWGFNSRGQIGNGTANSQFGVAPSTLSIPAGTTSMALGYEHTCALNINGTVSCWGDNSNGRLGAGPNPALTPISVTIPGGVTAISTGIFHTCAIKTSSDVTCWGVYSGGQFAISIPGGVTAISASPLSEHTCALKTNGDVACWGTGTSGQLGNGANVNSSTPVTISIPGGITAISVGAAHTCALKTNGDIACWGAGNDGQLGNSANLNSNVPVTISIPGGVTAISAGGAHTCALKTNGDIACWGRGISGQLATFSSGGNTGTSTNFPVNIHIPGGVTAISAGGAYTCALKTNLGLVCWGENLYAQLGSFNLPSNKPLDVTGLTGITPLASWK
jgi:alpha-tubulin suppressor-like RCC1 family protein